MFRVRTQTQVETAAVVAYEEFDVEIDSAGRRPTVRVLRSPCGTPTTGFEAPACTRWSQPEWFHAALEAVICNQPLPERPFLGTLQRSSILLERFDPGAPSAPRPSEVGHDLFQALFPGPLREALLQSLALVHAREGGGLRIRLHFDPDDPEQAKLCRLPWELLFRSETREFLALNRRSTLVRCLDVPGLARLPRLTKRLRLAVIAPRPRGVEPPDGASESAALRQALLCRSDVDALEIEPPTIGRLREALRDEAVDALHFVGHGTFDDTSGEGALLLESPAGEPHIVTGRVLAETLRAGTGLRLVFLNACDGARLPRRAGQDPYAGVATALVMSGIPAALAMQFPISEEAALQFSGAFYKALSGGDPVDVAVTEGRVAVLQALPETWEWATPALYMSTAAAAPWPLQRSATVPGSGVGGGVEEGEGSVMKEQETTPTVKIDGQQRFAFGIVTGSQVVIHEHKQPSPAEEARRQAGVGRQALDTAQYEQADRAFQAVLATGEASAPDRYHAALARVCHRGVHALTGDDVRLIEAQIGAIAEPEREHVLLRALIKDAYGRHGMTKPPSARDLLTQMRTLRPRREEFRELARHLGPSFDWSDFEERYGLHPEELPR